MPEIAVVTNSTIATAFLVVTQVAVLPIVVVIAKMTAGQLLRGSKSLVRGIGSRASRERDSVVEIRRAL
jgi:hypothetical protein